MKVKQYTNEEYQAVRDFLITLNQQDKMHINWNWARFEWMMEHPEFDKSICFAGRKSEGKHLTLTLWQALSLT